MGKQDDEKVAIGGAFALGMIVYILGYGLVIAGASFIVIVLAVIFWSRHK